VHAVGPDVGTPALLFAAARNPGLFVSLVVGSGATDPELAGAGLKDLIKAPAGGLDDVEGGGRRRAVITQSAAVATPAAVLEDYRLSSAGRRFAEAAKFVRAYRAISRASRHCFPPSRLPCSFSLAETIPSFRHPTVSCSHAICPLPPRAPRSGHLVWEEQRCLRRPPRDWLRVAIGHSTESQSHN